MLNLLLTLTLIANSDINSHLPITLEMARYRTCLLSKQMTQTQINEMMRIDQYDFVSSLFTNGLRPDHFYYTYQSKDATHWVTIKLASSPNGDGLILDTVEVD